MTVLFFIVFDAWRLWSTDRPKAVSSQTPAAANEALRRFVSWSLQHVYAQSMHRLCHKTLPYFHIFSMTFLSHLFSPLLSSEYSEPACGKWLHRDLGRRSRCQNVPRMWLSNVVNGPLTTQWRLMTTQELRCTEPLAFDLAKPSPWNEAVSKGLKNDDMPGKLLAKDAAWFSCLGKNKNVHMLQSPKSCILRQDGINMYKFSMFQRLEWQRMTSPRSSAQQGLMRLLLVACPRAHGARETSQSGVGGAAVAAGWKGLQWQQ